VPMPANDKNRPVELLEESLQVLRCGGASILLRQWGGSVPFAVALLLLLHDTGLDWGGTLLLRDSLLCALAFVWMSYWKGRAARIIYSLLSPGSDVTVPWPVRASFQAVVQTLKLFVMPLAAASLLAWPVASAFFRSLALEPTAGWDNGLFRGAFQRAFAAAGHRYSENAVAFLALSALAVVTCLNITTLLFVMPALWKMLTGSETDWSRMQNPTLLGMLAVSAVATWLLMDPWIQTYCVLRVFYQNARSDGRDLLREIARLAAIVLICSVAMIPNASAAQPDPLKQAIDRAAQGEDYGWLRPPDTKAEKGFLADLRNKANGEVKAVEARVQDVYRRLDYWLRNLLNRNQERAMNKHLAAAPGLELRWVLGLLAVLICGVIVALSIRTKSPRIVVETAPMESAVGAADVMNEGILPSEVKQEEWLRLASEYLENNQTRLAARAFYLANLSHLGAQSLLKLSLSKSNKLYERELARQPKSADLTAPFAACNRLYERAWYGMRELGAEQVELLKGAADQLRQHA
jgi:hypothetical protein